MVVSLTWRNALVSGLFVVVPLLAHLGVVAVVVDAAPGAIAVHLEDVAVVCHQRHHPGEQVCHVLRGNSTRKIA